MALRYSFLGKFIVILLPSSFSLSFSNLNSVVNKISSVSTSYLRTSVGDTCFALIFLPWYFSLMFAAIVQKFDVIALAKSQQTFQQPLLKSPSTLSKKKYFRAV